MSFIPIKNNDEVITIIGVPFTVLTFEVNREFKQWCFWATLVNQKLAFFFLICLGTTKFVLLSVFTLKETICPKICSKSRLKSAQSPLSVDVRRSKTENRIYSPPREVVSKIIFVCLFFARRPHQNCARVSHAMAQLFRWNRVTHAMAQLFRFNHTPIIAKVIAIGTLSSAEAPAGYPYKDSNNYNNNNDNNNNNNNNNK